MVFYYGCREVKVDMITKEDMTMKMAMRVWMVFVLLAFIATSASGEIRGGTISVSPFVGGYTFEGNENLQTKALTGIRLGYNLTDKWGLEGVLTYMKTDNYSILAPADLNVWGYRLDALYHLCGKGRFACSLAAGLGIRSTDYKDNSVERRHVLADYGLVLQYFLTDNLAARGDLRHMVLFNDKLNNVEYTIGLTYYFGGYKTGRLPAAAAASAATSVAVKDSDNDGVPDKDDDCPGTPRGAKVDSDGCPVDSDRDGVPDHLDKCPSTPAGAKVDSDGCPGDSDKDGVYDDFDKCPGTPLGVQVDSDGCVADSDKDGVPDYLDKCSDTLRGVKVGSDGCPADSDKDGVPDYLDKCPGTPLGVQVDGSGCAVLVSVPVPAPVDSDKDDVIDFLDKCPDTPLGVKVDKDGCPLDSDKDGVPDYLDKCPGTKLGATVDSDGCRMEELKKEATGVAKEMFEKGRATIKVEFDFNKADIKPQYHQEIKKFADVMQNYPDLKVVIEGNTDITGKKAQNQELSKKRAESVKKYLVEKFGVEESRLTTRGLGGSRPIASNKTKDGRKQNRRVEAVLDYVNKK